MLVAALIRPDQHPAGFDWILHGKAWLIRQLDAQEGKIARMSSGELLLENCEQTMHEFPYENQSIIPKCSSTGTEVSLNLFRRGPSLSSASLSRSETLFKVADQMIHVRKGGRCQNMHSIHYASFSVHVYAKFNSISSVFMWSGSKYDFKSSVTINATSLITIAACSLKIVIVLTAPSYRLVCT